MQIFRFGNESGKQITHFDSDFILSRILITDEPAHIGCMHLGSHGVVGLHQATSPQLLLVVDGQGWVRGDSNQETLVSNGDAVFWEHGEWHQTRTETGLTAIVIESDTLAPERFMPSRTYKRD